MRSATIKRCSWVSVDDSLMLQYHDREWGVPVHDDRKHFEFLVLEGAQAGLSWTIVLKKWEGFRRAFDGFDPEKVARFSARRIKTLALDFVSVAQPLVKMPAFTAIVTTQSAHVRFGNS
jgi:DNA-3-methyladenine glycosylase I